MAIRLACELIGIGPGDEILAPSYNCGSEIDALLNSGASVTLYRIDKFGQVDLADLQRRINTKTRMIYLTHYFGFRQPLAVIRDICDQSGLYLFEDCALSLFSSDGVTKSGSKADVSVFNFPKTLPVPDGGTMIINNPDLTADRCIMQRPCILEILRQMLPLLKRYMLHKLSGSRMFYPLLSNVLKKGPTEYVNSKSGKTDYPDIPSNYYYDETLSYRKMSKISERMLRSFDAAKIVSRRRINFRKYLSSLSTVKVVEPLYKELPNGVCPLYFPIIVNKRGQVCQKLNALSIDAVAWWSGYHRSLPWAEYPEACFLKNNILALPVHQQLNDSHIEFIARKLLDIIDKVRAWK